MIDVTLFARRHNLPLEARGLAIPTTSSVDSQAIALIQTRIGRTVYRTAGGLTVAFARAKLKDALGIVGRAVREEEARVGVIPACRGDR